MAATGVPAVVAVTLRARRRLGDRVAVRHPHDLARRLPGEERRLGGRDRGRRLAVLARAGARDRAAERARHGLEAVAHAEDRHPGLEQGGVEGGSAVGIDRARPAGEDDRRRLLGQQVGNRHRVRHDLAVDLRLAHAARDELGVLRAVVDDEHGVALEVGGGLGRAQAGHGGGLGRGLVDHAPSLSGVERTPPRRRMPGGAVSGTVEVAAGRVTSRSVDGSRGAGSRRVPQGRPRSRRVGASPRPRHGCGARRSRARRARSRRAG